MKKLPLIALGAAALIAVVFHAAPFQGAPQPLARLFPSGALLYLEAKDFQAGLRAWNTSAQQRQWLESRSYEEFQRSNLFLKLQAAGSEFAGAAGLPPDSALLDSLAGGQSAIAVYDIGDLQFLYLSRLPTARLAATALWQSRVKYETRHAGESDFFVRVDSGRTVAFAAAGGYLILGTQEELVAGALRLLAGESLTPVSQEAWFADAAAATGEPGDFRLVTNLPALLKTPQFRSYWIQRNRSELRNYRAGIADLVRSRGEIREERILLRNTPAGSVPATTDDLTRLAPPGAAFYRSWTKPAAGQALALVEQKLLAPRAAAPVSAGYAPQVDAGNGETGAESDLETRIDQPPMAARSALALDDLRRLLEAAPLEAMLAVQSAEPLPDGVFVSIPTVVCLRSAAAWDRAGVRRALGAAAGSLWSVNGAGWVGRQRGGRAYDALDGLAPLEIAVEGNVLFLANSEQALGAVLDRAAQPPVPSDAASLALFRHTAARDDYRRIMTHLDHLQRGGRPAFYSGDLWSLSEVFSNVHELEVRTRDLGSSLRETVLYRIE